MMPGGYPSAVDVFAEMEDRALAELSSAIQGSISDLMAKAWPMALARHPSLASASAEQQAAYEERLRDAIAKKCEEQLAERASTVRAMFHGARIAVRVFEQMEDERRVAAPARFSMGLLNLVELALPPRLVAEDMGDMIERLNALQTSGASSLKVLLAGVAGALWIALNGVREAVRRVHGKSL